MRIAISGGVANSHYIIAKFLKYFGLDVTYIYDSNLPLVISHPVWEEFEQSIKGDDVDNLNLIKTLYRQVSLPDWTLDIRSLENISCNVSRILKINLINILIWLFIQKNKDCLKLITIFNNFDFLIVGNGIAEICAPFSSVPYMIWPSGGDLRLAAGTEKTELNGVKNIIRTYMYRKLLKYSFENASILGSHNPLNTGALIGSSKLKLQAFKFFPLPMEIYKRLEYNEKSIVKKELSEKLGIELENSKLIILVPSRIDFYWKGTDKFIKALLNLKNKDFIVYFLGWGNDREHARKIIKNAGLDNHVKFLSVLLSKPLLRKFMMISDLVVDQFNLGTYGTLALESMSVGTPVMMWINNKVFEDIGVSPPPVINAQTEEQIQNILEKIIARKVNLSEIGIKAQKWIEKVHHYKKVIPDVLHWIKEVINAS